MISPFRLPLTLLFAGAAAISCFAATDAKATGSASAPETPVPEFVPSAKDPESVKQWQWNPQKNGINITNAWNNSTGKGVTIGLIGQWVKAQITDILEDGNAVKVEVKTHDDLKVNTDLAFGFQFEEYDSTKKEDAEKAKSFGDRVDASVGTALAGLAAATGGNDKGVIGAAPGAEVAGLFFGLPEEGFDPEDTENEEWAGYLSYVYEELTDALEYKNDEIRIKTLALDISGSPSLFPHYFRAKETVEGESAYRNALDSMIRGGGIYVVAAGDTRGNDLYGEESVNLTPADANGNILTNYEGAIVVGATNDKGVYASTSNYGANLFVVAPGSGVYTTSADGGYGTYSGASTLAASAVVSGVIALAAEKNYVLDSRWAKHAIVRSTDITKAMQDSSAWSTNTAGIKFSNDYGFGMINADKFVDVVEGIAYQTSRGSTTVGVSSWEGAHSRWSGTITGSAGKYGSFGLPIESVEVSVNIDFKSVNYLKDVKIELVFDPTDDSKDEIRSVLMDNANLTENISDNTTDFTWTFVSNAFWGMGGEPGQLDGEWKLVFTNNSFIRADIKSASLKFNTGAVMMEAPEMTVSNQSLTSVVDGIKTLSVDALVLDKESTTFSVGADERLTVAKAFIINDGKVTIADGGEVLAGSDATQAPKLSLQGGTLNLNKDGVVKIGVEVAGGTLNLNGGSITDGSLNIFGGRVNVLQDMTVIKSLVLSGGTLASSANGAIRLDELKMTGGVFEMGGFIQIGEGQDASALGASGGLLAVVADTELLGSINLGATQVTGEDEKKYFTAGALSVASGVELDLGSVGTINLVGGGESNIGKNSNSDSLSNTPYDPLKPIGESVYNADWDKVQKSDEANYAYTYAEINGSIVANGFNASTTIVKLGDGAEISCGMNLDKKSALHLSGTTSVRGGISLAGGDVYIDAGSVVKSSLKISDSYFEILGDGSEPVIVNSEDDSALSCSNCSVVVAIGQQIKLNKDVTISGCSFDLKFREKFPDDKMAFIETDGTLTIDGNTRAKSDGVTVRYWDKELKRLEVPLEYEINSDGAFEAYFPEELGNLELLPIRMVPPQATVVQKAVLDSLFTCVPEGPNAGVSKDLLDKLNSFDDVTPLLNSLDQFRPFNLITINSLNNKQAAAVTGTLERRSRELRTGYPVSDFWSQPLFNSYGFSFSANPNLLASNGMRQFMGYDLSDERVMLWANGGYSFSDGDAGAHNSKTDTDMINASIGFDYAVNNNWALGIFATYSGGQTNATECDTEAAMRSIGVYFAGSQNSKTGSFYYMGMASYGIGEYDFTRTTRIDSPKGEYNSKASAAPDGSQAIGYLAAGWEWDAGSQALSYQWTTGPMVSLRYTYNSVDGYTERGNGADALEVDDFSYDSLLGSVGWRATVRFDVQETITIVPEARLSWSHEFLDGDENINAALAIPGATPFSTTMNKEGSNYVTAGIGATVLIAESTTISLDYDISFMREDSGPEHNVNLMLRCRF